MKKRLLVILGLLLVISGCDTGVVSEKTAEERLAEANYQDIKTNQKVPQDYSYLERNIDVLLDAGNLIGPGHYDELGSSVNDLESNGVDVSILREKLARLKVAGRQDKEELVPEPKPKQDTQVKVRRGNSEIPTEQEKEQLPECDNTYFTTTPVDLSEVREITPLGNLGPPGHTFPTDHTYLHIGEHGSGKAFDLFAPADVHITSVSWGKGNTDDPIDYTIYFALCKDVIGYYNHVKTTSEELNKITDKIECEKYSVQAEDSCTKILLEKVEEGTLLGTVGWKQGNFDFGLIDLRKELNFINPERHPTRTRYIQCAYDYYREDLQKQFFDLIKREDEQQCGVTMQDVAGTLKGAWFHESADEEYVVEWDVYLAFVNDNEFPDVQVVSIAGIFTDPSKFKFFPKDSGTVNREFSQVTTDGKIYCYQAEQVGKSFETKPTGKILVQLIDDESLKIEHQTGSCSGSQSFNIPETYNR
jgi:hypothetical protein